MSTRKIKNARDLESNELIYFKSHAQATFMSDGSTVEDVINEIKETGGADLTDYVTTTQLNTSLSGKQDTISDLANIRNKVGTVDTLSSGVDELTDLISEVSRTSVTGISINGTTKTGTTIALGTVVTGVTMNGSAKTVSNGKVDLGTIITAHQTLKTINGESIVGSGNIEISGGSSDANVQAVETGDVLDDVNVDYATSAYVDGLVGDINSVLDNIIDGSGSNNSQKYILWNDSFLVFEGAENAVPNVKYICTVPIVSLEFNVMVNPGDSWHGGITEPYSEYTFIFTSGDECSITTRNDIKWANGTAPTIESGVRYELSISLMYINNEYIGHAVLVPFKTV